MGAGGPYIGYQMPGCVDIEMYCDLASLSVYVHGFGMLASTPEARKSFTRSTELITSLPISSKTRTFHVALSAEGLAGSGWESSWASMSVMGAFRLRMRFMLARRTMFS